MNATSQSATEKNVQNTPRAAQQDRPKKRRNVSRVNRAKTYFQRKKAFYLNSNNRTADQAGNSSSEDDNEVTIMAL